MKLINKSAFPSEKLRNIIRFCCPPGVRDFIIRFQHWNNYGGVYYAEPWLDYWSDKPHGNRNGVYRAKTGSESTDVLIKLKKAVRGIGLIENRRFKAERGYLASTQYTQEEVIVHLVAHELRHVWQARNPMGRRVWGARSQYSERDADAYAIGKVRHWRRAGSSFFGPRRRSISPARIAPNAGGKKIARTQSNALINDPGGQF
jgi:hypothetical protein